MDHRSTHLRAFSLVEAMVTVVIVGSLFALALPRLKPTLKKVADAQEVSQIIDALRGAQRLAIDSGCRVKVFTHDEMLMQHQVCAARSPENQASLFSVPLAIDITLLPTGRVSKNHEHCVNDACLKVTQSGDIFRQSKDDVQTPREER